MTRNPEDAPAPPILSPPWRKTARGWLRLAFPRLLLPRRSQTAQGLAIHYALTVLAALFLPVAWMWRRRGAEAAPRRAIFVSRAHLGDFLMSVPALALFKRRLPGCHVGVVLQGRYHCALDLGEVVHETWDGPDEGLSFPSLLAWWLRFFRGHPCDTVLFHRLTRPDFPALLAAFLLGIPRRVGGADKGTQALLTHAYFPTEKERVARYHLNLVAGFLDGLPRRETTLAWPRLVAAPPARRRDVLIVPFAQHSKVWPAPSWHSFLGHLRQRGLSAAVVGAADQRAAAAALLDGVAGVENLAGTTDLPGLFALVEAAGCVVTVDTGVRHIAAALGVPCVVLGHGREHRRIMGAYVPSERYLVTPVSCAPCGAEPCPLPPGPAHLRCIHGTAVAEVLGAFDEIFSPTGAASR